MATASKNGLRELAESSFSGYRIDPRKIKVEKGHNVRNFDLEENQKHVESLASSIAANGVQNPLVVRFTKGEAWLVDGECRLRATMQAIKNGADIKTVPVIQEPQHTSEEDRIVELLTRNSGKQLNFLERGEVFTRLKNFGWTDAQIAQKTGITQAHVSNIMALHTAPKEIKKAVADGTVSSSTAIQLIRDHGEDAPKVLKEVAAEAKHDGKAKITAKDMEHIKPSRQKEKRDPFAFTKTDAKDMLAALCDIYFNVGELTERQIQTVCRNVFEDKLGADWKAIASEYNAEVNQA